jgi:hypothetical protein
MTTKEIGDANFRAVSLFSQWWGFGRNGVWTVTVQGASRIYFLTPEFEASFGFKSENKNDAGICCAARQSRK